ncbi:hypothetical protein AAUPMC_03504, partial [Pasteurella multocida subsp. multocida str. Anand1_cattle]
MDEFQQVQANCEQDEQFIQQHDEFVRKRAENLAKSPVRRQAEILSLPSLKPRGGGRFALWLAGRHIVT